MFPNMEAVLAFMQDRQNLGIKPGLHRMEYMLNELDHPEKKMKAIHIGGTNGKGSVTTYLQEVLLQHGYQVGTFMSPSLDRIHDHIKRNDVSITDEEFVKTMQKIYPVIKQLDEINDPPTEFEILVLVAIVFLASTVDYALFEVGMGGRDDSTNCIQPILTIITTIGLDHTTFLGNSYANIAEHKAGIIKSHVPILTGVTQKEALRVIEKKAEIEHAPLYRLGKEFHIQATVEDASTFHFSSPIHTWNRVEVGMKGNHQAENAALALMGLFTMEQHEIILEEKTVRKALREATVPGRFEVVSQHPHVIVDGAHNVEGMKSFMAAIDQYYGNNKKRLLFAAFRDKPIAAMLNQVNDDFEEVIVTTFDHPRAAGEQDISALEERDYTFVKNWEEALHSMLSKTEEMDHLFIVGSLHFVGKVRKHFV
ncbi:bifunctional folylpolyglutamate synthase/dihydrofolate synthase [Radiobacillus kanasensis]|uniref:bifunctional folylpolyglutamate synthase/dihydrofolate synthase n=1 Tax=Radiobacillus kanasensis TaxID=2844358 RepID=UPI001E340E73|nr:folylpolyglutamate synthase/dihydrofolate synthase family protein [Radiobacillus kanasensis]UFT97934.1 bifunctional folylpolyglutamate synthase/dihydrofolate synthase [Radiobacillus kanasensis]